MKLLDLFCGAGGAGEGYRRAGFDVTGVDNQPMPNNPHTFIQADALEYLQSHGHEYDAIHASPPCQGYSRMRHLPWLKDKSYPMLINPVRSLLELTGKPWVIENVEDAPLHSGITLCGTMFGLKVYRHRRFESSAMILAPPHHKHTVVIGAGRLLNDRASPNADGWVGHPGKSPKAAAAAMGIDWMTPQQIAQAIPPAYTEYIGKQLMQFVLASEQVAA